MIDIENDHFRTTIGIIVPDKNHQKVLKLFNEYLEHKTMFVQFERITPTEYVLITKKNISLQ